jgi:hypothetical protein
MVKRWKIETGGREFIPDGEYVEASDYDELEISYNYEAAVLAQAEGDLRKHGMRLEPRNTKERIARLEAELERERARVREERQEKYRLEMHSGALEAALRAIAAYEPGTFWPLDTEISIQRLAKEALGSSAETKVTHEIGGAGKPCPCKGHPFNCFNHPHDCGCQAKTEGKPK